MSPKKDYLLVKPQIYVPLLTLSRLHSNLFLALEHNMSSYSMQSDSYQICVRTSRQTCRISNIYTIVNKTFLLVMNFFYSGKLII